MNVSRISINWNQMALVQASRGSIFQDEDLATIAVLLKEEEQQYASTQYANSVERMANLKSSRN